MAGEEHPGEDYHAKDALGGALSAGAVTGTAGLFVSSIQNTLQKRNIGAFSVFTRTGSTVAVFGTIEPYSAPRGVCPVVRD